MSLNGIQSTTRSRGHTRKYHLRDLAQHKRTLLIVSLTISVRRLYWHVFADDLSAMLPVRPMVYIGNSQLLPTLRPTVGKSLTPKHVIGHELTKTARETINVKYPEPEWIRIYSDGSSTRERRLLGLVGAPLVNYGDNLILKQQVHRLQENNGFQAMLLGGGRGKAKRGLVLLGKNSRTLHQPPCAQSHSSAKTSISFLLEQHPKSDSPTSAEIQKSRRQKR
ncbi:hypothetical protein J6590_075554 [Homalodisca vitripennis]|nr:hypothetical protein J6590_075554 [Homalodisca vitripennis]